MDQRLLLMHQAMLGDRVRLRAYDQALRDAIRPGCVVIDVGAGSLVLSLLSLKHGARHVYAVEADPAIAAVARRVAESNRLQGRLTLVQGDAREVRLPEKADVVVSEMMGNLGPEEEMAEILDLVARRNLAPGGRLVPGRLVTSLQAIEFDDEGWGVWRDDFWGFSLSSVQEALPSAAHLHFFSREPKRLSAPAIVRDDRFGESSTGMEGSHVLEIHSPGRLHAIVGYFTATLAPEITLSNFPSYPGCNWAAWVWPVRHTGVTPGDRILVHVIPPQDVRLVNDWRLDCRIARGAGRA